MPLINWESVFDEKIERRPGATEARIQELIDTVSQPVSDLESESSHSSRNPETWSVPGGPLPESYLDFLRWSDGGVFRNGDRLIQFLPSLGADGVRETMLAYSLPYYVLGILPFAWNGGGVFYAFDMRFRPRDGEYSIVAAECGHAHTPFTLAPTFPDACRDKTSIEDVWDAEDEINRPWCKECGEALVCPECGKRGAPKHW